MKKNLFYVAATAAMLASCTSEVIPERFVEEVKYPVEFRGAPGMMTRATRADAEAAALLGNQFNVSGRKWVSGDITPENPEGVSEVFEDVPVVFANGKWDYVNSQTGQELRYWDTNATKYQLGAYSDANVQKVFNRTYSADGKYQSIGTTDAGVVTAEQLSKVYVTPGQAITPAQFTSPVTFTFSNAAAKVNMAFYNAIPGYNVAIDAFYASDDDTEGGQAVVFYGDNGFYQTAAYNVATEDVAMTPIAEKVTTKNSETFGTGIYNTGITNRYLGRSITEAVFDKTVTVDGVKKHEYTFVHPVQTAAKDIKMRLKYRMVSGHETINRTSTVIIPAAVAQWKPNHAYTYFFKITDNDLHPITFTAQVTDFTTDETITTIDGGQDVNITTWVEGSDVQNDVVYKKGSNVNVAVTNYKTLNEVALCYAGEDAEDNIDGSNAEAQTHGKEYIPLNTGNDVYTFNADKKGKWVIRVSYLCNVAGHDAVVHTAYKVVRVVE